MTLISPKTKVLLVAYDQYLSLISLLPDLVNIPVTAFPFCHLLASWGTRVLMLALVCAHDALKPTLSGLSYYWAHSGTFWS